MLHFQLIEKIQISILQNWLHLWWSRFQFNFLSFPMIYPIKAKDSYRSLHNDIFPIKSCKDINYQFLCQVFFINVSFFMRVNSVISHTETCLLTIVFFSPPINYKWINIEHRSAGHEIALEIFAYVFGDLSVW